MKKMLIVGAAAAALLTLGGPGHAATESPSPSPSVPSAPSASSPGSAVPTNASGAPVVAPQQKIDPYVRSSIVYLTIKWKAWPVDKTDGTFVFTDKSGGGLYISKQFDCTGYVVNPDGYIATAGHCVSPLGDQHPGQSINDLMLADVAKLTVNNGYFAGHPSLSAVTEYWQKHLRLEGSDELGAVGKPDRVVTAYWGANVSGIDVSKGRTARVLGFQQFESGDAALIKVNEPDMNALLLVPGDTTVDTGTGIAAVGYAGSVRAVTDADFHPDVKTGTISSQKTRNDIPVYELDAAVSPGMSGGPTVNDQGQVIGTNSFGPSNEPQSFNFVGTSQRVLELLNSQGVSNELSQDAQDLRAGLDAYFAGDKATAVAKLSAVKENQPSNDIVTDYLGRAQSLADPPPPASDDNGGVPVWVWVLIAVLVLLALATGAALLIMRQRSKDQRPVAPEPVYAGAHAGASAPQQPQVVQGTVAPPVTVAPTEPTEPTEPIRVQSEPEQETPVMGFRQQMTRQCSRCSTPVPGQQQFCGNCGNRMV